MNVYLYADPSGKEPFTVRRLELDQFGQHKSVGEGVCELILDFGPGYRIYYGTEKDICVILLLGGHKSSQDQDIKKAKLFWKMFKEKENGTDARI